MAQSFNFMAAARQALRHGLAGKIGASATLVYLHLADRANADGECWPAISTIAKDTGLAPRTVKAALKRLEDEGLISRQRRGNGFSNTYQIQASLKCKICTSGGAKSAPLKGNSCTSEVQNLHFPIEGTQEDTQQAASAAAAEKKSKAERKLQELGLSANLSERYPPDLITEAVEFVMAKPNVRNPAGMVRTILDHPADWGFTCNGTWHRPQPAGPPRESDEDRLRRQAEWQAQCDAERLAAERDRPKVLAALAEWRRQREKAAL
ncbi:MAG: hypothetical protein KatS3mg105_1054 [Gemmatales bacterium]|nr:MAG: hypothetical protein KatS3mg105_1054 [Gemmatales bacterium]